MSARGLLTTSLLLLSVTVVEAKVQRSTAMVREFRKMHPCPSTQQTQGACPGWVVDHVWPLCAGGDDDPDNMQWQPQAESLLKDKWEWALCRRLKREHLED